MRPLQSTKRVMLATLTLLLPIAIIGCSSSNSAKSPEPIERIKFTVLDRVTDPFIEGRRKTNYCLRNFDFISSTTFNKFVMLVPEMRIVSAQEMEIKINNYKYKDGSTSKIWVDSCVGIDYIMEGPRYRVNEVKQLIAK